MNGLEEPRCIVCQRSDAGHNTYGNRIFCDQHYATFPQATPSLWRAMIVSLLSAVLPALGLGIATEFVFRNAQPIQPLIVAILAGIPAVVWIFLTSRLTRTGESTFASLTLTMLVAGILVATAVSRPLLFELIGIEKWLGETSPANRFFADILVQGFFHSFLLYVIVRYSVWQTPNFVRRSDGILFAISAGWGYASTLVILALLSQQQVALQNGSLFVSTRVLAYLIPAPVVGYVLGRNRFEDMPFYYLSAGVSLAATLCGVTLYAATELNNIRFNLVQDGYSPWPGLILSIVIMGAVLAAVVGLTTRHNNLTRARLHLEES